MITARRAQGAYIKDITAELCIAPKTVAHALTMGRNTQRSSDSAGDQRCRLQRPHDRAALVHPAQASAAAWSATRRHGRYPLHYVNHAASDSQETNSREFSLHELPDRLRFP